MRIDSEVFAGSFLDGSDKRINILLAGVGSEASAQELMPKMTSQQEMACNNRCF